MFTLYINYEGQRLFLLREEDDWGDELQFAKFFLTEPKAVKAAKEHSKKTNKPIGQEGGWNQSTKITRLTKGEVFDLVELLRKEADKHFHKFEQLKGNLHMLWENSREM